MRKAFSLGLALLLAGFVRAADLSYGNKYAIVTAAGALKVDGTATPQPVTGTFWQTIQPISIASMPSTPVTGAFWQTIQPVSVLSLPLPSGAATAANQLPGNASLASLDAKTVPSVQTATVANLSVTNGSAITLLATRAARIKAILFNDNNTLYIKAGAGASNADYTWRAPANTEIDVTNYTGPITAILNTAGPGTVHVSDF